MFKDSLAYSSFSVDDLAKAESFYGKVLGLNVEDANGMGLTITLRGGGSIFVYEKPDHTPASFTILNFVVKDIDKAAAKLAEQGIKLKHYEGLHQGKDGIARSTSLKDGPSIAWFTDPAGNVLAVQEPSA